MSTTLLIDTDIIAYRVAAVHEDRTAFGVYVGDLGDALKQADGIVGELMESLKADRAILCLSDSTANWRNGVLPTYKHNREGTVRPELLAAVKAHLATDYESKGYPTLEADDVMGILATHPNAITGRKIIVSEDKDMRTIPCSLYAPHRSELGVIEISELDANRFHMWQTICGDATDGYKGAPGIGPGSVYAEEVISAENAELWDIVLDAYAAVRLTETEAIQQAQVARILRAEDYNIRTKEMALWAPELLG